ncbi:hypothetical protein HYQ46_004311 [Verticillium longisporum]|nr:hypothetical protein HYQ46_004311 [Verticillium longisporum]
MEHGGAGLPLCPTRRYVAADAARPWDGMSEEEMGLPQVTSPSSPTPAPAQSPILAPRPTLLQQNSDTTLSRQSLQLIDTGPDSLRLKPAALLLALDHSLLKRDVNSVVTRERDIPNLSGIPSYNHRRL